MYRSLVAVLLLSGVAGGTQEKPPVIQAMVHATPEKVSKASQECPVVARSAFRMSAHTPMPQADRMIIATTILIRLLIVNSPA
jgi:hypothetical protein